MKRGAEEPAPDQEVWLDLSQNWREFNDERVSFFFAKNIAEQGFGGYMTEQELKIYSGAGTEDWSKSAYLLVYEKKLKSELRQVVSVDADGSERVETLNFNAVPKEIPSWIEEKIKADNRVYVADTQIFH